MKSQKEIQSPPPPPPPPSSITRGRKLFLSLLEDDLDAAWLQRGVEEVHSHHIAEFDFSPVPEGVPEGGPPPVDDPPPEGGPPPPAAPEEAPASK